MDTIESLQSQLKNTESKFSGYGADLPGEIESQIQKAYSPLLKESLGVTKGLMGDYLGRYFDTTQMGPGMAGTTAMDLSPTQKLGVMGRELGTMAGDLQATTRYSDYLGGQMNDLYSKAVSAAQLGRQDLSDEYSRTLQQLQMAQQLAEAEKDRALQRELAANSGGGTVVNYNLGGDGTPGPQAADPATTFAQKVAYIKNLRVAPDRPAGFNIDAYHTALKNEAKSLGLNIGDEELWIALGNNPSNTYKAVNPAAKYFDLTKL